jgi:ankyrin repeat protein
MMAGMTPDGTSVTAAAVVEAIHSGDVAAVERLLELHRGLASARGRGGRTALHVVTDWPGYFPNGPAVAQLLLQAGADPDARTEGKRGETPLHWAASSDDLDVADVLIDGGADIEAADGSIGTPLANAVGYGCWHVARRLVERGAPVAALWQAAALGLNTRVRELMDADPAPDVAMVNQAFWHACHGGQRRVAEYLLASGADLNARPDYAGSSVIEAVTGLDTRRELLVEWLRGQAAPGDTDPAG